jgi:hypothetical protein
MDLRKESLTVKCLLLQLISSWREDAQQLRELEDDKQETKMHETWTNLGLDMM